MSIANAEVISSQNSPLSFRRRCLQKKNSLAGFFILSFFSSQLFFSEPLLGGEISAITRPSADVSLSFVRSGQVAKISVKEGDLVKKGAPLARLEDQTEILRLKQLAIQAENLTDIKKAQAELRQKKADAKKISRASEKGAATVMERERAELEVELAIIQEELVHIEHQLAILKHEEAVADQRRMRLTSPINGSVESVKLEPGEIAEASKLVIRVVSINPLWIDLPLPLAEARKVTVGTYLNVRFPALSERKSKAKKINLKARVIYVSAVADSASETLRIRLEVPNSERRFAGERVLVTVPATQALAMRTKVRP